MISFREFLKDPIKALLFLCLLGISYLYFDVKSALESQIANQQIQITSLQAQVFLLQNTLLETITNHTKPNEIHYTTVDTTSIDTVQ